MKETVRIIGIDLDDTLLHDDLTISDYTVSVLQTLMQKGIRIVLASGRNACAMQTYITRIGTDKNTSYIVANNGAQILASDTGAVLKQFFLNTSLALEVFDLIEHHNLSCHLYVQDTIYVLKETRFSGSDSHLTKMKLIVPPDYRTILKTNPVYKLVIPGEPDIIKAVEPVFRAAFLQDAVIFTSKPYFLEVIPLCSGKGEALIDIAARESCPAGSIMAFGDSMNDESMIRMAGFGIAMKNAVPAIRATARTVTDYSNNEDGVARFLEKYVL